METQFAALIQALNQLNRDNLVEEQISLLNPGDFPTEWAPLIAPINRAIEIGRTRIHRERRRLDILNSIIHSGMWSMEFDQDGVMNKVSWSQAFRQMVGFSGLDDFPDTLESWSDRLHPEDKEHVMTAYWASIAGEQRYDVEYRLMVRDGSYKWFRAAGEVVRRNNGKPSLFLGIFLDITHQKENQRLVREYLAAQAESRAKTEFLSHMSHDIRTPINGIMGMLEIAERNPDDQERQADCRKKIRTAAQHLLSLINDVLDLTKLENSQVPVETVPLSLPEVVDTCFTMLRPQAEANGLLLDLKLEVPFPNLIGSPLYLRQILINLISNAVKYNRPRGTVHVRVTQPQRDDQRVLCRLEVADTGIGMSEEFQQKLFQPFTQANHEAQANFRGTGLGMAITKGLVEKLGGTIAVTSQLEVGTTFTVEIPLDVQPSQPQTSPEPCNCQYPAETVSGLRVMLVEDNELNREIAQYLLEDAGVAVTCTPNGLAAVELFSTQPPGSYDAILMDVIMPVMDGLEATRKIRASDHPDGAHIPILAMTANAFTEDVQQAREAGMTDHLSKPIEMDKVLQMLCRYCRPSHLPT